MGEFIHLSCTYWLSFANSQVSYPTQSSFFPSLEHCFKKLVENTSGRTLDRERVKNVVLLSDSFPKICMPPPHQQQTKGLETPCFIVMPSFPSLHQVKYLSTRIVASFLASHLFIYFLLSLWIWLRLNNIATWL